ncbi:MAG TPA: benzoate-CoA ligase family protein [Chloroflexota bacterium]|nr:benzoate-CoA ligase family protein [Chloroflexota bacterium]
MIEVPDQYNACQTFIDENVGRNPDRIAVRCQGQSHTYRQMAEMVGRAGNSLSELGVRMEDRVLLLMLDTPEFIATFYGAIRIGAVPVPVNTNMKPQDYEYFLNDSRAVAAIVSEPLLAQIEPVRSKLRFVKHLIVAGAKPSPTESGSYTFEELLAKADPHCEIAPTSKDDVCFWLYSSGTTGFPKGAVHLQHDAIYTTDTYAKQVLGVRPDDRLFSVAKLFFAYGIGNALNFPFRFGATSILHPGRPDPASIFDVIERERPTLFFGVPTAFAAMLAAAEERQPDLSSIRLAASAGEALPAAIYERWKERFGHEILDGIGSTEILHIFISNRAGEVRPGSSGSIVPGYEAKLLDDDGQPAPQGEAGNLWVKGDSTCAFYWNKHERTKDTISGHWIRTGDKYHQDQDGCFYMEGRSDDMLKVGGIWVSPVEVESALIAHEAVLECAVVGDTDKDELVKPRAFVVLKPGRTVTAAQLQAFVKDRIAPYKYPRWIDFVDELPKTATGKIQRYRLRGS